MKMKKAISFLVVLCLIVVFCCQFAFADTYYSDVVTLLPDFKGQTEGILDGDDYPENTHITEADLTRPYEPWMAAAVGDYFTEEYYHNYCVYWQCVYAGIIKKGDDLDLSQIIKKSDGTNTPATPVKELVGMASSYIEVPENYAGRTEGVISAADVLWDDALSLDGAYGLWMKMEYGSDFTEAALHEYQLYWKTVEAGYVEAGKDLDISVILNTELYSDGSTVVVNNTLLDARYKAMRMPSLIVCAVILVLIFAGTTIVLFHGSNKRYKAYLASGGAAAKEAKAEEPAGPVLNRKQVVTLNLFGNEVLATVLKDEADTVFSFSYTLGDKEVTASGEIKDGQYVVTDDPAGVGKMVIKDIVSMLTDEWA